MMKKIIIRFVKEERGNVLAIVAAVMLALLGLTALVIDGGRLYFEKSMLQKAADAGALAGAQELPFDSTEAEKLAIEIAVENNVDNENTTVEFDDDNMWIRVTTNSNVELTFGKIFGISTVPVTATAKVELNRLTSGIGVVPLGIEASSFKNWQEKNCVEIILKDSSPNESEICSGSTDLGSGNAGALQVSNLSKKNEDPTDKDKDKPKEGYNCNLDTKSRGGNLFEYDLACGSKDVVTINQIVETEPGVMAGLSDGVDYRKKLCESIYTYNPTTFDKNPPPTSCAQVVIIPLYTLDVNGDGIIDDQEKKVNGKHNVRIVGFATMFLIDTFDNGKGIKGRFIDYYTALGESDPINPAEYGTYGYKLVE